MKLLPLKGYKSLRALNAFHTLLLGLKMLPAYIQEPYDKFFESFKEKSEAEKEKAIRQAAVFVQLSQDEVEALLSFALDRNGVPYAKEQLKSLPPEQIFEIVVAVCMEIGRISVDILTEDEKKKSPPSVSTSEASS